MNPLAVDYPPAQDDPLNAYPQGASFGDELFQACTIPQGWYPEVVQQSQYGNAAFTFPYGWAFTMTSPPSVNTEDVFTYRLTDGQGNYSNTASVRMLMAVER